MSRRPTSRGFTLIEMCMAMIVMAMIASAVAAFSLAMGHQWRQTERQQYLQVASQQSQGVLGGVIESSRQLGSVVTKYKPGIFLWQSDNYLGAADGKAQFCEMSLIEFDPSLKSIFYYQGDVANVTLLQTLAFSLLTTLQMQDADIAELFKLQTGWLKTKRPLLGPGRVVDDSLEITRVEAAEFIPMQTGDLPAVKVNLTLSRGDERVTTSNVYTLRAPTVK